MTDVMLDNPQPHGQTPLSHPIVYFDGVCGLCNWSVDVLMRLDHRQQLRFTPLQGETALANLSAADREDLQTLVFFDSKEPEPKYWRRSDAVLRALEACGGPVALLARAARLIPAGLRDIAYKLIARVRYRVFGQKATCRIPTAEERRRFLP